MTDLYEPVGLRFRGHERTLPILALAAAFRHKVKRIASALDTLIHGPPDEQPLQPTEEQRDACEILGEGGKGGVAERSDGRSTGSSTSESETSDENHKERSERERRAREGALGDAALARRFAHELGDEENFAAIRKLVATYPLPILHEALRRTLAVPPERIRESRGALFTGIVRKLAADADARTP